MWAITVGTHSFIRTVVPVLSLVSICASPIVCAAGYLGAAGGVAVVLAAWVVSLYSRVFVDFFRELASAEQLERADRLLV